MLTSTETVNCYCFNPHCDNSIFHIHSSIAVKEPIDKVLTQTLLCKVCKKEMVAKPLLEMRRQITDSLVGNVKEKVKAIFIDDDPFFLNIIKHFLDKNSIIAHSTFCLNALDVIAYLKLNSSKKDELPDLIFVDINMPHMNGFEFLEEFEKLYVGLLKKSRVYMTSSNIEMYDHEEKTRKYPFVKGLISKPFGTSTLEI